MAGNRTYRLASAHGFPTGTNNSFNRLYSKKTASGSNRRKQLATAVKANRKKWGAFGGNSISTELTTRKAVKKFGSEKARKIGQYLAKRKSR